MKEPVMSLIFITVSIIINLLVLLEQENRFGMQTREGGWYGLFLDQQ